MIIDILELFMNSYSMFKIFDHLYSHMEFKTIITSKNPSF